MAVHQEPHIKNEEEGILTEECGHHCGVITMGLTDQHIGHCKCGECHNEQKGTKEV